MRAGPCPTDVNLQGRVAKIGIKVLDKVPPGAELNGSPGLESRVILHI